MQLILCNFMIVASTLYCDCRWAHSNNLNFVGAFLKDVKNCQISCGRCTHLTAFHRSHAFLSVPQAFSSAAPRMKKQGKRAKLTIQFSFDPSHQATVLYCTVSTVCTYLVQFYSSSITPPNAGGWGTLT
jgi:hypothetical protein